MKTNRIRISEADALRLRLLVEAWSHDPRGGKLTARLREELARATIVPVRPPEVVGLDCEVEVADLETGEVECYTLVLPEQADVARGRLSLLAPLGTALLGFAEGDEFSWQMPGGFRQLQIRRVGAGSTARAPAAV